jgi:hypothetical protein
MPPVVTAQVKVLATTPDQALRRASGIILLGSQGQMLNNLVYNGFKDITVVILNLP